MKTKIYYDVDETIFTHDPEHEPLVVILDQNDKVINRLSSTEYNSHKIDQNVKLSFDEFVCAERFSRSVRPVRYMIDKLKEHFNSGADVDLLTARSDLSDKEVIIATFLKHGIDIRPKDGRYIHLHRAGNYGYSSASHNKHLHIIDDIKKYGYDHIEIYDDNAKMLDVMKKISETYNIQTRFHHVKVNGDLVDIETHIFVNGE